MLTGLVRMWEVPDRIRSLATSDAVVGMSIAQLDDGKVGKALQPIIDGCCYTLLSGKAERIIISNRFVRNGIVLSDLMRRQLVKLGVPSRCILSPPVERNQLVQNTYTEVLYTIEECKKQGFHSLIVVANHLHMRRTLAAFKVAMKELYYDIDLYWISVGRDSYGEKASCQPSFSRMEFFLFHEMVPAFIISVLRGMWRPWL